VALEVPPPEAIPEPPLAASSFLGSGNRALSVAMLVVSVVFAIAGQFTLKAAMNEIGRIGTAQIRDPMALIARAAKEPRLWAGLALFGISALFWLVVLSRVNLSVAYPLVGVSYILVVAIGRFVLNEEVPFMRWVGVTAIALGIAIIGFSFRGASGT
jgi:multidrug transporter EmrE-like cation transporter